MTMPEQEPCFNDARTRPQQRRPLAFRFSITSTATLIFAAFLALSCGGHGTPGVSLGPVAPSPEITIQFLSGAPVVQHGYLVGFRARTVGIADPSALEWSVNGGEIDRVEADRMWWWPPNVPDGEQYTITVSYFEYSGSLTVTMQTELPPTWADEIEISFYYDFVQSSSTVLLVAEPDYWRDDAVGWNVSAGEVQYYENPSGSGYFWITPDTSEDMEVLVTFLWRGIPVAERHITVRGTDNLFFLNSVSGTVVIGRAWIGDNTYEGSWYTSMWTPDYDYFDGEPDAIYVACFENWEPAPLPAHVSLIWNDWNPQACTVEVRMTQEDFNTLLPATADLVVRSHATEEGQETGVILWEERIPFSFIAYSPE